MPSETSTRAKKVAAEDNGAIEVERLIQNAPVMLDVSPEVARVAARNLGPMATMDQLKEAVNELMQMPAKRSS